VTQYLVTGGGGFIGSHLVRALLSDGEQVRVVDNFSSGKRENLAGLGGELQILEGDIRDQKIMAQALKGVEVVFHEAAFVSVPESMLDPQTCFDVNAAATVGMFEAARQANVKRVVIASSAAVYGDSQALPLRESSADISLSPYAASKRTGEIYAQLYTRAFGLDVVALRYFNVFGPRQSPDSMYAAAVPIFIRNLLDRKPVMIFGDGGQTRDLIFVQDVVRANRLAARHEQAPGRVFNICTGQETRLLDLMEVLLDIFPDSPDPVFGEPRAGDIYRSVGSPDFTLKTLGFQAEVRLEQGLKETAAWMKA
jgi:UDP-glucose 4-epimerase